jgi:hypothetical protein
MTGTGISCFSYEGDIDGGYDARLRRQLAAAGGMRPTAVALGFSGRRTCLCASDLWFYVPEMSAPWGGRSGGPAGSGAVRAS